MNRSVFAPALALLFLTSASASAFAQAQPASPTTPAPAAKAKFVTPLKGVATIEVIQTPSKFVGKEIQTVYKIKNTSSAPIALLKIDEYWYDSAGKLVSSDTKRHLKPFGAGEIIEIKTSAPGAPGAARSQATFSHANGTVKPKRVTKFQ
jgi:hypothetical protein